jgi:hypothetical protein
MLFPQRVYKYEPFSVLSLQNLKQQAIYFGSPMRFNDPYDCALSPRVKEPNDDEIEKIRSSFRSKPDLDSKYRETLVTSSTTALRDMMLRIGQKLLDTEISKFLSDRGVSCFSEINNSLLMWSHYSGHFKGFCLEFRTDLDLFQKLRKVRYTDQMPEVDIVPMLCDDDFEQVLDLYCTKALDWQYEQEWRVIHSQGGTSYTYPTDALTGIYMGPEMDFSAFEIIALILAGQSSHVQLWQGHRSKSEFAVEFEPVTYTSHLEAKRLGLLPLSDA